MVSKKWYFSSLFCQLILNIRYQFFLILQFFFMCFHKSSQFSDTIMILKTKRIIGRNIIQRGKRCVKYNIKLIFQEEARLPSFHLLELLGHILVHSLLFSLGCARIPLDGEVINLVLSSRHNRKTGYHRIFLTYVRSNLFFKYFCHHSL